MSRETIEWLNTMTLIGNTKLRGNAWHYREAAQGNEPNHYEGFIPVEDVKRRLLAFQFVESPACYIVPGNIQGAITTFVQDGVTHSIMASTENRKGMLTSDTLEDLGMFKSGYQGHSYQEWLLDNVAILLSKNGHELGIGSAGLLRKRAQMWVSIELDETITTPEDVEFMPFLSAMTSFDGSLATGYGQHKQMIVCDNTLETARGEGAGKAYRLKHTKYSTLKIMDAREAIGIIFSMGDEFKAEVAELCAWKVSDLQFNNLLDNLMPIPEEKGRSKTMTENKRNEIITLYRSDSRAAPWNGTAFGVLQAFNTWNHHFMTVKGEASRAVRNMENVLSGKMAKADNSVLEALQVVTT